MGGPLRLRQVCRSWVELAGAGAIAVAWPVFQNATSGPDAFTRIRADQLDLILFGLVATLVLPTVLLLVELLVGLGSARGARLFHALALGALFGLVCSQAVDSLDLGAVWPGLAWLGSGLLIAFLWLRTSFVQTMATIFAVALPVTLISFWFIGPGSAVMAGGPSASKAAGGSDRPPVVMLVLDEFPLIALESRPGRIDRSLFPGFAALARESTWFAAARSPADETVGALPALLSGRTPESGQTPPASHDYPDNLFTVLGENGYRIDAREQVTDLCPHELCGGRSSRASRMAWIARNGLEHGNLYPARVSRRLDDRLRSAALEGHRSQAGWLGRFRERPVARRGELQFLHLLLPHVPWTLLPDARTYDSPYLDGLRLFPGKSDGVWSGERGLVDSSFQRFMLQAQYLDREIAGLVAELKERGTWDETMLVVVADHGASFAAGSSRRYLTEGNAGWILPVPLFVKLPGQTRGRTIDRPFSTAGLPGLILEELDLERPAGMLPEREAWIPPDGTVRSNSTIHGAMHLPEPEVSRQAKASRAYRNQTFAGDSLFATGGSPGLLGSTVERSRLRPLPTAVKAPWPVARVEPDQRHLPVYVSGEVSDGSCPAAIALSLNGRVAATVRPWRGEGACRFATVVDPDLLRDGLNRLNSHSLG